MTTDATSPSIANPRCLIVTGASSGIGHALALRAAADGFAVLAVARREDRLADLAKTIRARNGRCEVLALDVRDPNAAKTIVARALAAFGRIDVLVNNAGMGAI
ncbi:MAG: SDR family NAD(P)-dependent oxidoreductase, partial [Candidatus Eremiobacteraeota bacterium]|nr:SDR family NAD(P)-dependent oxidoreductase [Candidatus Eremiobacteraeota bacterium]